MIDVSFWTIAESRLIYPGYRSSPVTCASHSYEGKGQGLVRERLPSKDQPNHPAALLFTIVAMFSLKGAMS